MKKALGVIAVLGSAAALIAYKMKKDEKKNVDYTTMDEDDISERILKTAQEQNFMESEEAFDEKASLETATYPNLNEDDMVRLNEISEARFEEMDLSVDERRERPLQHVIVFDNETALEKYKAIVINDGYVVTSGNEENELVVLNISEVDPDAILSKVFYLANLAKEYHGTYVNWVLK